MGLAVAAVVCVPLLAGCGDARQEERESAAAWKELRRAEARLRSERGREAAHARARTRSRRARDRREGPKVLAVVRSVNASFRAGRFETACASYSPAGRRDVAAWLNSRSCAAGMRRAWSVARRLLNPEQWNAFLNGSPRVRVRGSRATAVMTPPADSPARVRFVMERSHEELVKRGSRWQIASFP